MVFKTIYLFLRYKSLVQFNNKIITNEIKKKINASKEGEEKGFF
jgi:hypothetical protein